MASPWEIEGAGGEYNEPMHTQSIGRTWTHRPTTQPTTVKDKMVIVNMHKKIDLAGELINSDSVKETGEENNIQKNTRITWKWIFF